MMPLLKILLLYLLMLGLVAFNAVAAPMSPLYVYIVYIIIIFVVVNSSEGIFWGKKRYHGLLLGTAMMGAVFIIEMLAGWIRVDGFYFDPSMMLSLIILQILVAVGEEISFRGYILRNLINYSGIRMGIFLSSLMFSAIHIPSIAYYGLDITRGTIAFMVVGMLGGILAMLYLDYGLISAIGFHFAWNLLQYNIFTLAGIQPGLVDSSNLEPNFLTGGNYGPEAGVPGLLIVFFSFIMLIKKHSNSHKKV